MLLKQRIFTGGTSLIRETEMPLCKSCNKFISEAKFNRHVLRRCVFAKNKTVKYEQVIVQNIGITLPKIEQ